MPQVELHPSCDISVVIPVLNEQDSVVPLWHEIREALEATDLSFEAIYVDDGSTDASADRIEQVCRDEPRVRLVRLVRNFGQTAAMSAGIELACGRVIVPLDADGQNDPASIPKLVRELDNGFDVVSGWRRQRKDGALLRRIPSVVANRLISWVTGVRLHDYGCTLKAYKAEFIKDVRLYGEMHRFIPVYAAYAGARIGEIEVNHRARKTGASKYGLGRTFRVLGDLILVQLLHKYRSRPMHLFGRMAFPVIGLGAMSVVLGVVSGIVRSDWIIAMIGVATGLVLVGLGVTIGACGLLAELVMRAQFEARDMRPYTISSLVNFGRANEDGFSPESDPVRSASRPH